MFGTLGSNQNGDAINAATNQQHQHAIAALRAALGLRPRTNSFMMPFRVRPCFADDEDRDLKSVSNIYRSDRCQKLSNICGMFGGTILPTRENSAFEACVYVPSSLPV